MADAIVSGSSEPVPALPLQLQCIPAVREKLDQAHLCAERLGQVMNLAVNSLREQNCEGDEGIAVCLESVVQTELDVARLAIEEALEMLQKAGVSHG